MIYYFIGIKGSGMSALACVLYDLGYEVTGSDKTEHFFTEEELFDSSKTIIGEAITSGNFYVY